MTDSPEVHGNQHLIIFGHYEEESHAVHAVVSAMNDAEIVQVSKSLLAGKLAAPEVHGARAYFPRSGRKLSIKQKSADAFILRATSQKERAKLSNEDHRSQKIELDDQILNDFLSLLRLVQLRPHRSIKPFFTATNRRRKSARATPNDHDYGNGEP